ncbi:MAG: hypothetical protein ABSA67_10225 [Candidatus Brocadiia bacterium]
MRIARVFPRWTTATPTDDLAFVGYPDLYTPDVDRVYISVAFTWDMEEAEKLASAWEKRAPVTLGGPALGRRSEGFTPGQFIKRGYTITSRGCPNRCWFCEAWKREGPVRELPIMDGFNVLDDNLLACSRRHIEDVFAMLGRQKQRARLTGGLEARRLEDWHVELLARRMPDVAFLAYDTADDWEPLVEAARKLRAAGLISGKHRIRAYVLCGWPKNERCGRSADTIRAADERCRRVARLGIMPAAMLYDNGVHVDKSDWHDWRFAWSDPAACGKRMKEEGKA